MNDPDFTRDAQEPGDAAGHDGPKPEKPMEALGILLIVAGAMLAVVGVVLVILSRLGGENLPGNLHIQVGNVTIFSPCLTMILISVVGSILLTIIVNVILRLLNR